MGLVDPRDCSPPRSRLSMNEEDWPCAEVMGRHCGREGVKEIDSELAMSSQHEAMLLGYIKLKRYIFALLSQDLQSAPR